MVFLCADVWEGNHAWVPCFLFFVSVLSGTCVFSNNTTIGAKLCNSCAKKRKCWGASKPVPPSEAYNDSCLTLLGIFFCVLCSKRHFLAYIWACSYFFKLYFEKYYRYLASIKSLSLRYICIIIYWCYEYMHQRGLYCIKIVALIWVYIIFVYTCRQWISNELI